MKRLLIPVSALLLAACSTSGHIRATDTPEYALNVPAEIGKALKQGETLRFGPKAAGSGSGSLEHCGQICHTFKVCTPDGCENEYICVDNPNCDGHHP